MKRQLAKIMNMSITKLNPRGSTKKAMEHFNGKKIVAAEIGVYRADNSLSILKHLYLSKLYCIDPWKEYYEKEGVTFPDIARAESVARNKLMPYSDKVEILKMPSERAIPTLPMCDFIYIDGNHDFEFAYSDMKLSWKKVKKGGIMAGHDYNHTGVMRALVRFCYENKLVPLIWGADWVVYKHE